MEDGGVFRDRQFLSGGAEETLALCADGIGRVDVLTAGYPCQPFSTAARGRNVARDLWPDALRIILDCRPRWVVLENVPGSDLEHVERSCSDLEDLGYAVWPLDIAVEIRNHVRRRCWVVAHADGEGESQRSLDEEVAGLRALARSRGGQPEPVGVDAGLSGRMDRLHALGNSIEPEIAEMIFRAIEILSSSISNPLEK